MRPSLRFEVFKRDAFMCVYCGRKSPSVVLQIDHVLALSQGGRDELDNLVSSCEDCNHGKAARPISDKAPGLNAKDKAERIAEHEAQIAEYSHWLAAQRGREDEEIRLLANQFEHVPGAVVEMGDQRKWFWKEIQVRQFLRRLGYHELRDAIDICSVNGQTFRGDAKEIALRIWKYFCGICWHKIKGVPGA